MKYIFGNWKANKSSKEIRIWFEKINSYLFKNNYRWSDNLEVVIFPPFVYLSLVKKLISKYRLPIRVGAQDVSIFSNGAYTGEVTAQMLVEYVDYVMVGHSERRNNFQENDKILLRKIEQANFFKLKTILCVQDENTKVPSQISFIAYEPVWAIGSGVADTPQNANKVLGMIKRKNPLVKIGIYGGSVKPENIKSYLSANQIDGVLPGGASLDPDKFGEMIINASTIEKKTS